jgi:hypothetical protein
VAVIDDGLLAGSAGVMVWALAAVAMKATAAIVMMVFIAKTPVSETKLYTLQSLGAGESALRAAG